MRCKIVWFLISADVKVEMFQDRFFLFSAFSLVQDYPGATHFFLDLSFKYFLPMQKGRTCILGRISLSFSFIQRPSAKLNRILSCHQCQFFFPLSLYLTLSLSSNKKIYLLHLLEATKRFIYGTVKSLRQKKFSHSAA